MEADEFILKHTNITDQLRKLVKSSCQDEFLRSARFEVLADGFVGSHSNLTGLVVDVTPHVMADTRMAYKGGAAAIKCHLRMFVNFVDIRTGALLNKAPDIDGTTALVKAALLRPNGRTGDYVVRIDKDDMMTNVRWSAKDACNQLKEQLNIYFPVTAAVTGWDVYKSSVSFAVRGGTGIGMTSADDITLYYADEKGITLLANTEKNFIGETESTINPSVWNAEPRARLLKERILRNDKELEGRLFVVCNKVKDKK